MNKTHALIVLYRLVSTANVANLDGQWTVANEKVFLRSFERGRNRFEKHWVYKTFKNVSNFVRMVYCTLDLNHVPTEFFEVTSSAPPRKRLQIQE